jgi:apolipoprotein D and lipocalin family protein
MQYLSALTIALSLLLVSACGDDSYAPLATVDDVDLERYQGTWYEIARLPMWFQRGCVRSQARYTLRDDGSVDVINSCTTAENEVETARGRATVVEPQSNAKLELVFDNWFSRLFPDLTKGQYWIIALAPDYSSAMVGHPNREYLWILARSPQLEEKRYKALVSRAKELGFDIEELIRRPTDDAS